MGNELPEGWEYIKMKELCKVVSGSTPKTNQMDYWDGDILWITPKDLSNFNDMEINDTARKITKKGYDSCSTNLVPPGTVLMSSRAPIGYLAIAGKEVCTNQGFKSFICTEKIYNKYLYFFLKSIIPQLKQSGSGTTFDELSKTKAEAIEVPIPFPNDLDKSLQIQKQVVSKLDAFFKEYDILKEEKEKAQDNHDKILQSAINKIYFPDKFKDGWRLSNLSEVAHIIMGQSPPSNTYNTSKKGIPFFQGKKEFGKKHPQVVKYCAEPRKLASKGDTLLSVRAPVGPVNMASEKCCIGRGLAAIQTKGELYPDYIYNFMKGNESHIAFFGRGSTFDAISGKDIKKIQIPVPPNKEIQKQILDRLEHIFNFQEAIHKEKININKGIESLPFSVLTKAFAGELA